MKLQGCKLTVQLRKQLFRALLMTSAPLAVGPSAVAQTGTLSESERTFVELLAAVDQASEIGGGERGLGDNELGSDDSGIEGLGREVDKAVEDAAKLLANEEEKAGEDLRRNRSAGVEAAIRAARKALEASQVDPADADPLAIDAEEQRERDAPRKFNTEQLVLADVVASLYRSFPEIQLARRQSQVAGGELLSAYGAFDTKFQAHSLSEPTGFYRSYRNGLGVARQTWYGGYVSAGYRIGRGLIQPWYQERQTNDAGEFKVGIGQALLQGRAIDPQRVAVFQASLEQQAAAPIVQQSILDISRDAVGQYWKWVAAGAVLEAQRELLRIAEDRAEQFRVGVAEGKFPEVDSIFNDQLIAERQSFVLKAEQKFRAAGFKLGVFLRDEAGQPMVPDDGWLPSQFPEIALPESMNFAFDLGAALSRRPEIQILQIQRRQVSLDRQLARNNMLPRFDFVAEASQDMGEKSSKKGDKGDFELVIGFTSEVPIQLRKARGKIQSTNGKMLQIDDKLQITRDKIAADLQTAQNSLRLTAEIVQQNEAALKASLDVLARYRFAFNSGKIDLIYLNLLETKANETEIKLLEAKQAWFMELGMLQYVLALDPLEQAMVLAAQQSEQPGEVAGPEQAEGSKQADDPKQPDSSE